MLIVNLVYTTPRQFARFRLHDSSDSGDMVPFESMLALAHRGWTYERKTPSRKLAPYKQGTQKTWYFNKTVCKYYLRVLLNSGRLFELGLKDIYHFQPSAYYRTLLFMMKYPEQLNTVSPWQNRAFYVLKQQHAPRARARQSEESEPKPVKKMVLEIEDEGGGSFHCYIFFSCPVRRPPPPPLPTHPFG